MRFFNDMKFWQKLVLIVTALTVPTVYMLVLLKQAKDSAIDFSAAESLGVAHNAPLLKVLPAVAHLDLALALDTRAASDVERWRAELAAALPVAAREVDAATVTLDSKSGWDPIAARLGNAAAGAADMERAGAGLVELVLHVGDTSNLILDPDIDSFYVMDAIVNRVPELVRNLGRYAALAGRGVEAGRFDAARYSEIMVLQSRIAATLDDMKRNLAKAMAKNDTLEPALGASLHDFDAATAALIGRVTALKPDVALDREALAPIVRDAHAAIDAGATFYTAASPALDRLLDIRIGGLVQDERTAFVAVAICLAVAFAIAFAIIRTTSRAIGRAVAIAGAIAGGNLDNDVVAESRDEIGALLAALAAMQDKLRALLASSAAQLHETNRIREALDFASASLVLAGADGRIVYLNRTASRLFESAADDLRRVLGDVDPRALVGASLDRLRGDAAMPAFGTAETAAEGEARFGDRVLHFALSPVRDAAGIRLGTVLEVTDLTEQKSAEAQIESMILGAANGELDRRLELEKFEAGFLRRLAESINRMLDALIAPLETAAACIERIACGDIPAPVTTEYAGRFRQLRDNINHCIAAIMRLVEDTERLSVAGVAGQLATRADVARHDGDFRRIVEGINNTLDAIVGPIAETQAVIGGLANGDLTQRMHGPWQGEFAQLRSAVNATLDQLHGTIERIRSGAANIQSASSEIATGNLDLNRRTEQQGANLEETAASMEELTSTVKQNAENSREADRVAAEARVHAEQGGAVVGRAVAAMAEIANSSKKIGEIISVIDGLAFQTNLLALNAAVEAARAGEQGRGFAVVAAEVRNLAQRSSSAAKEIRMLIQDSVNRVDEGSRLVNESGGTLAGIVESVNRVCGLISGIAAASEEQSSGIGLVNSAVAQMEEGTQQNVALVEETAAASKALDDQTRELLSLLACFRTGDDVAARRPADPTVSPRAPQRRAS